jgi:biotin operon repressor
MLVQERKQGKGQLAECDPCAVVEGPRIAGFSIQHRDAGCTIFINGRGIDLSPTEYRLCMPLFERKSRFQAGLDLTDDMYTSFEELEELTGVPRRIIPKHMRNARGKLLQTGLDITRVGDLGYTLTVDRSRRVVPLSRTTTPASPFSSSQQSSRQRYRLSSQRSYYIG